MRLVIALCVCVMACKKDKPAEPPPATPGSGSAAAKPADPPAMPGSGSAAPAGSAAAAPALPSLGPAPAGMDAAKVDACNKGDAAACYDAASAFAPQGAYRVDGKLTAAEADRHELETGRFAQRACELGNGDGCVLAARFLKGKDQQAAQRKGCELGKAGACGDLGWGLISNGDKAGLALLEQACRGDGLGVMGSEHGTYCNFAESQFRDKKHKDLAKAKEMRDLACKQGWMENCPCKTDADCKGTTTDVNWFCAGDKCAAPSAD